MNNKGFTLIEIVGVLVILSVISIIAITSIGAVMKNSREQLNEDMIKTIKDSAINYTLTEHDLFICNSDYTSCNAQFTVETLIDKGYFVDSGNKCNKNANIIINKIKNGNEYKYEFNIADDICLGG